MDIMSSSTHAVPAYDHTGKLSLDHVYNRPDPREYFSALSRLDYCVPEVAKPFFNGLLDAKRAASGEADAKIVDVGCSYGVNAALLKHDMSLDDLYRLYTQDAPDDHAVMLERDRMLFSGSADEHLSIVGLDVAENAISYAVDAGLLDGGVSADLESQEPTAAMIRVVENADLIISTGCVGYVTGSSLEPLVEAGRDPWMANFVLRMFDYEPVAEMMERHGYVTERLEGALFPQRRFVSEDERSQVLENLSNRGLLPEKAERDGWYLAELHVSRPAAEASTPLADIFSRQAV